MMLTGGRLDYIRPGPFRHIFFTIGLDVDPRELE